MDVRALLSVLALALLFLCALQPLGARAADPALFGRLDELCRQAKADARGPQRDLFWSNLLQCWQMEDREDREDTLARLDEHVSGLCRDIATKCSAAPDAGRAQRMAVYSDALQCRSHGLACEIDRQPARGYAVEDCGKIVPREPNAAIKRRVEMFFRMEGIPEGQQFLYSRYMLIEATLKALPETSACRSELEAMQSRYYAGMSKAIKFFDVLRNCADDCWPETPRREGPGSR